MKLNKIILNEGKINFAPWHITDPILLQRLIDNNYLMDGLRANKNGTASCKQSSVSMSSNYISEGRLKFQLQNTLRCVIKNNELTSIWGAPLKCFQLEIICPNLLTLEHLNTFIERNLVIDCANLKEFKCNVDAENLFILDINVSSLTRIDKYFKIENTIWFNWNTHTKIKSNILSFLLMKSLDSVACQNIKSEEVPFVKAIEIVNRHLRTGADVLECQEELISAGLKEFAKL